MPAASEKKVAPESESSREVPANQSAAKSPETKKKIGRNFYPTSIHLIQAYETVYKLSFLLNKKRCLMGNAESGFSLNCETIRKLRQLANSQKEFPFLPVSPYQSESTELKQKIYMILGKSALESLAEPIRKFSKQLLLAIVDLNADDESEENQAKISQHFQKPINSEQDAKTKITPYMLVQQIQKSVMALRARFLLEFDTLQQLRRQVITESDCYHALNAASVIEIKGCLLAAQEIYQSLKGMQVLKKQSFSGEFHPKITLERAIENLETWGPGTPPRIFHIKDDPTEGKTIRLNEKTLEYLSVLKEATMEALGYEYRFSNVDKVIQKTEQELREYYTEAVDSAEDNSEKATPASDAETEKDSQPFQQKAKDRLADPVSKLPISGPKSVSLSNSLSYDEILRFYAEKRVENPNNYLSALYFEAYSAKYLRNYILTVTQAQDLRGIFMTLQMDLSHAIDLYLIESQQVIKKLKILTKKMKVEPNPEELAIIGQPGEKTQKLLFTEAVANWTQSYIEIIKKYIFIQKGVEEKLVLEKTVPSLCEMEASSAIAYLEQLKTLITAEKKGYISPEQKEQYLDPKQTSAAALKGILAFLEALEKLDFTKRCDEISKGFRRIMAQYEGMIEEDSAQAKTLKDPIKQVSALADGSEANSFIQELLNAEIYDMEPQKVCLLMERILISLELKRDHLSFSIEHQQTFKSLFTKLSGGADIARYNDLFFIPKESQTPCLLGLLNRLNGTLEDGAKNVFHENDNTMLRESVLRRFDLTEGGLSRVNAVTYTQDLLTVSYCVDIMVEFQCSFLIATRKVFELGAETRRSSDQTNSLGINPKRVEEMKNQCKCILDKQVPISFALQQLETIWQTLESDKIVAKEAKMIGDLRQKFDGNVPGGSSLLKRLGNNAENQEMLEDYQVQALKAYADFKKNMEEIADRLSNLNKQDEIPKHILEYQRQIIGMERAIIQAVEELKLGESLQPDALKAQIQEKQKRIHKYKKTLTKYQKEHPDVKLLDIS